MAKTKPISRAAELVASAYFQESYFAKQAARPVPEGFDPDVYMASLFELDNPDGKLNAYIARELEWAEQVYQDRLAGATPGAGRSAAPVNSLPHGVAGGSGSTEQVARIRAHWE